LSKRVLLLVVTAVGLTFITPLQPAHAGYPCIGAPPDEPGGGIYDERRQFIDAQSWWVPTPGQNGTDHGHVHVGACIPEGETITGSFRLNIRMVLHDPGAQKVYPVGGAHPPSASIVLKDDTIETTPYKLEESGWTCSTPGTCTRWRSQTVDPAPFTTDGRKEIRFRFFSQVLDGAAKAQMTASLNFQFTLDRASVATVDDYERRSYLRGKGWYSDPGQTSTGEYCESSFLSVPVPDSPIAGTWTPSVKMVWHGTANDPPIASREARLDPDFHANPANPGTMLMSGEGEFNAALTVDTTALANGTHKLFLRSVCRDLDARGSDIHGILTVPFVVAN
jgi:hypothetical protein